MPIDRNPTFIETTVPWTIRDRTSRPDWSVPSQWRLEGPARGSAAISLGP